MYKKIFIDSEVFIDANDRDRLNYDNSLNALYYMIENGIHIYTSCSIIHNIYSVLSKIDMEKAMLNIENINKFATISKLSNLEVERACKLLRENKNYVSLEYTLQYILAKKENCKMIISNSKDFHAVDIEVISAKSFCDSILE
jgi:predicted nucleic acid-binding protein